MSFMDIVTNVVTGGAYGALTGNWGPETHATAPAPSTPSSPTGNFFDLFGCRTRCNVCGTTRLSAAP